MAGLFDFDVEARILDDLAINWDDPDNASVNPAQGLGAWGAMTATVIAQSSVTQRNHPRREYIWTYSLTGSQTGVIR